MIEVLIVAPQGGLDHHVPAGFIFADEVFQEARLGDPITAGQSLTRELDRALGYLASRFPRRIRVRRVDPWTPGGLWLAFRFRLRSFPAVILDRREVLSGEQLRFEAFRERITALLSGP